VQGIDIQRVLRARYGGLEASDIMVQFARIEFERPDALVWMQNGKFFEVYGDQAKLLGRLLDLRVAEKPLMTGRNKQPLMLAMTGIAIGSEREHLSRLLRMGYRVAIGREVEGERDGNVKARQLSEVITPGTIFDEDLLDEQRRLLASVTFGEQHAGLALADVSTGDLWCLEWQGDDAHAHLLDELARVAPAELLHNQQLDRELLDQLGQASGISRIEGERLQRHDALCEELKIPDSFHVGRMSALPQWWFDPQFSRDTLHEHFHTVDLSPFGLDTRPAALIAVGVLIRYLQWNQFSALSRLQSVRVGHGSQFLQMDATTRRTLDILQGPDGSAYGSLLSVLDHSRTPMGGRLLRAWLTQGLRDPQRLNARYDAIDAAINASIAREEVRAHLGKIGDLERILNRLLLGPERATPRDVTRLRDALQVSLAIAQVLPELEYVGVRQFAPPQDLAELLQQALVEQPRASLVPRNENDNGELLQGGWDTELDSLLQQEAHYQGELERLTETLSLMHSIRTLQLKRDSRTRQHYFALNASESRRVPDDWQRLAKGKEQYGTEQLRQLSDALNEIEGQRLDVERAAWYRLWDQIAAHSDALQQLARHLAQIDVLLTLAHVALRELWVRPQIVAERGLRIVQGRHPVVSRTVDGYIPSDVELDDQTRLIVLTGPNMSGKSTLMRMVALCVVLAQMGSFVPAEQMQFALHDRIFTRIGAAEDIASGRSTFLVEMSEVATIVHQATPDSLVVLDEVGRGTATFDGMALAQAIIEHLHDTTGCRGIFATHYHQLAHTISNLPNIACYQMSVQQDGERLVFLHTMQPGIAAGSFGIAVARMAGLPTSILSRAQQRLAQLEAGEI
jgi:DNA mismatch repair protein MutS